MITDAPSARRIGRCHPFIRQAATDAYLAAQEALSGKNGLRITYTLRTFEEQDRLYRKGRDEQGNKIGAVVTNAKAGQSYHNYGLALDFVLLRPDRKVSYSMTEDLDEDGQADWREVANAFKTRGFEWGGEWNFKDNPHVQLIPAPVLEKARARKMKPWQVLLEAHKKGLVDGAGYINLMAL